MSQTKFKGSPVQLEGEFIRVGAPAPDFELVKGDLSPLRRLVPSSVAIPNGWGG